ncbi:MAG: PfkB family carbohydrate kinase [Rhodospirillales bacterium]|nr:PfkB family carbohydrate kinase [Rhodospirillales bacterium]
MTAPQIGAAGGQSADVAGEASATELIAAVRRLPRASVLVVGDAMLDRYVCGHVERVSPEAPVPVLAVERELAMPGGAGNVVRNLGALGVAVAFVSVVGDDQAGSDLTGLIGGQPGVEPWLLVEGGRTTTTKIRMIAQGQQLLRVDRENVEPLHPKLAERMLRIASDAIAATSVTILSDYRKGVLGGDTTARLVAAARQAGRLVIGDLHGSDMANAAGADVILASRRDLARASGLPADDDAGVALAATALRRAHGFGAVLVGRGGDGMTLVNGTGVRHLRADVTEVFDVSGAGDTAVATLGAALATGAPLAVAARLAALAGAIAMSRVGTAVVRERDFLDALSPDRGVLRKIVSPDTAVEQVERWRRRGWRTGFVQGSFDPLRAGHEHLVRQARAVCDRLVVAVAPDALVRQRKGPGRPLLPQHERAAQLAAAAGVDLVVMNEDEDPSALLRALRPDVLVTGADAADGDGAAAALLGDWGGRVLQAERLAEPA